MARLSLIGADGVVLNVVEADVDWTPPDGLSIGPAGGEIGHVWNGIQYIVPAPPTPSVPASVRMWQARAVLSAAGHLATVDAAIANSGNAAWQAAWEYAPEISRASALVNQMAALLGLTSEQVDQMFRDGAALAV